MQWQLEATGWAAAEADWLIVGVPEEFDLTGPVGALDDALGGQIARLRELGDLSGKAGETISLPAVTGIAADRLLLAGLGPLAKLDEAALYRWGTTVARAVSTKKPAQIAVAVPPRAPVGLPLPRRVQVLATALAVGCVGQDLFRSDKKRYPLERATLLCDQGEADTLAQAALAEGAIIGEAVNLARELVNLPPRDMDPEAFARRAQALAAENKLACEILDQKALEHEKMGSLLAVAQGSDHPPRLVFLEYNGTGRGDAKALALVGKGVTFDSGGLSIKTTEQMLTMKCDMAGAATVLAALVAIARLGLPVRVMALAGLVENMTGGSAMKLGDVLRARSGTTIEVLNTDAEGRLVLADVLDYAVSRGASSLVDLATLTGACVVALGEEVAGAMTNNQPWCDAVLAAARSAGEDVWQLPMFGHYEELIKSDVADIKNVGGRWGGAITAAKFLERFVGGRPWVHLDIAGPAFAGSDKPHRDGGGTGALVRTLVELARHWEGA